MNTVPELMHAVEAGLQKLNFPSFPSNLYDPMQYMLGLGGKRLRPVLVLLGYQLRGTRVDAAVQPALAVEIFHNFTLMHDDIMDAAPLRRGKTTVHKKWNETIAILSGDALFVKAYEQLVHLPPDQLPIALRRFNETALGVCEGQQLDMDFEVQKKVGVDEYLEMIRLKTAVLLGYSLELGGLIAGMSDQEQHDLYQAGELMGIAFQLMDDFLDVYADQSKFGKQVGGDIIANKKTYLLINALERSDSRQRQELDSWISKTDFDPREKVMAVKKVYDEIGIAKLARDKMNAYFESSFSILKSLPGDEQAKEALIGFAQSLIQRER